MSKLGENREGDSVGDSSTGRHIDNSGRSTEGRPNGKNREGSGNWESPANKPPPPANNTGGPTPPAPAPAPSQPSPGEKFFADFVSFVESWSADFSPLSEFASQVLDEMDAEARRIREAAASGIELSKDTRRQQVANALGALDIINKVGDMHAAMSILRNYNKAQAEFASRSGPGKYTVVLEVTSGHEVIVHSEESAGTYTKESSKYFSQEITVPRRDDLRSDEQRKTDETIMELNLTPEQRRILEDYRRLTLPKSVPQVPSTPPPPPPVVAPIPVAKFMGSDAPKPTMGGGRNTGGRT